MLAQWERGSDGVYRVAAARPAGGGLALPRLRPPFPGEPDDTPALLRAMYADGTIPQPTHAGDWAPTIAGRPVRARGLVQLTTQLWDGDSGYVAIAQARVRRFLHEPWRAASAGLGETGRAFVAVAKWTELLLRLGGHGTAGWPGNPGPLHVAVHGWFGCPLRTYPTRQRVGRPGAGDGLDSGPLWDPTRWDGTQHDGEPMGFEPLVAAMYCTTQAWLAAAGVRSVCLAHGNGSYPPPIPGPRDPALTALSSWTTLPDTAHSFARWTPAEVGTVYTARVPAQRIWSTPAQGAGFHGHGELLLLGGTDDLAWATPARAVKWGAVDA